MNEEKDRYGEFIRLLERAREDVYFAEKDRELIQKLKRRGENAPHGQVDRSTIKCPRCNINLGNATLLEFPVSHCSRCGGIWLDPEVLPQFMNVKAMQWPAPRRSSTASLSDVWPAGLHGMGSLLGGSRKEGTKPMRHV